MRYEHGTIGSKRYSKKGPSAWVSIHSSPFCRNISKKKETTDGEKIFEFNRAIIDATEDIAGCFKVQIACYEALGLDGMRAFSKTLQYARSRGNVTITDAKARGYLLHRRAVRRRALSPAILKRIS